MKKKQDDKETLRLLKEEIYSNYYRKLSNIKHIDTKIAQLFIFTTALIGVFINTLHVHDPTLIFTATAPFIFVSIDLLLFISSFALLLRGSFILMKSYTPKKYFSIGSKELVEKYRKERPDEVTLLNWLIDQTSINVTSIKENISKKSRAIKISSHLIVVSLILIIILRLIQGG